MGLHDEIFQGATPVLAGVDAASTYCYLLMAEQRRDADTWGVQRGFLVCAHPRAVKECFQQYDPRHTPTCAAQDLLCSANADSVRDPARCLPTSQPEHASRRGIPRRPPRESRALTEGAIMACSPKDESD